MGKLYLERGEILAHFLEPGKLLIYLCKNRKKLIIILTIFSLIILPAVVRAESLWDIKNHWAQRELSQLVTRGIIKGYGDGSFKPEERVTRAQFAKMIVSALGHEQDAVILKEVPSKFADVPVTHWANGYITAAWELGIVKGDDKGNFFPDENIKRTEITAMIVRALNLEKEAQDLKTQENTLRYKDAGDIPLWAVGYVNIATKLGIITGMPDNTFRPNEYATRAQGGILVQRMMKKLHGIYHYYGVVEEWDGTKNTLTLNINDTTAVFDISPDTSVFINEKKGDIRDLEPLYEAFIILNPEDKVGFIDSYYIDDRGKLSEINLRDSKISYIKGEMPVEAYITPFTVIYRNGERIELDSAQEGDNAYIVYSKSTGKVRILKLFTDGSERYN